MRVITKTRDTCELNTPFKVGPLGDKGRVTTEGKASYVQGPGFNSQHWRKKEQI